jgi:hypothetical protein
MEARMPDSGFVEIVGKVEVMPFYSPHQQLAIVIKNIIRSTHHIHSR